jgi:predicted O-methyltransferase YrrM
MKDYFGGREDKLVRYLNRTFQPEDAVLKEIRERSLKAGLPEIQLGSMDALHLEVLTRTAGAKKAVEIGTLGGYSGTAIARGLGKGGRLHTFELDRKHAEVAMESFQKAGVVDRVIVHVGAALERLPEIEHEEPFDLVFIDADKVNTPAYFAWSLEQTRPGGLIIADNVVRGGTLADGDSDDPTIVAQRRLHEWLATQDRISATTIQTVGVKGHDGFTLGLVAK